MLLFFSFLRFKVADYDYNYNFTEINITGDSKIGYRIKSGLLAETEKEKSNLIIIKINLQKLNL